MTLNTSDRKSIRAAEKAAAIADKERGVVITNLMASPAGRAYVWAKLEAAHMFQTSFNTDPLQMAFSEGERNQGIQLLNDIILWCPEQYIQAMRESNDRSSSARRDTNDSGSTDEPDSRERAGGEDARGDAEGPGEPARAH